MVRRVYVEKKDEAAVRAKELTHELRSYLGLKGLKAVRVLIRYDVEHVPDEVFEKACRCVFAEPPVDRLFEETFPGRGEYPCFTVEYLPGQFDQRSDSAVQCVRFLSEEVQPQIRSATTYVLEGDLSEEEVRHVQEYCVNPVDSRIASEEKPDTLTDEYDEPANVAVMEGFTALSEDELADTYASLNLAMTLRDLEHIQRYFAQEEQRDPTITEIRVLDTYWSDHCRHTTFQTELTEVEFEDGFCHDAITAAWQEYLKGREEVYAGRTDKSVCLMDLALMAMKQLKKRGLLTDQEETDEINACSIVVPVTLRSPSGEERTEEWLINFKNETHNHPTEIEPFGGAATCLGGAIRDPLSGRTYVYQAMRVTGAADPRTPLSETLKGKLPQKKLVREAARGYSSYGNQVGLATGHVHEIYHPAYAAKRMEIGAVIAAAPRSNVRRLTSDPGNVVILLGGRTGRDGIGGATGSSKVHTEQSLTVCGAEVQKGNAPTERKLQRLFRRPEVSVLIRKCNDFGAGGVSVAIGELADGLTIDLDKVPRKYAGLDGTELAISESQERMAVVVDAADAAAFLEYAHEENLEAVPVAVVTEEPRLVMNWRGRTIVDISRAFLDTNGAHQETQVRLEMPSEAENYFRQEADGRPMAQRLEAALADLNECSQRGLVEMFDSTIGAGTVLMPYGGRLQKTPEQVMVGALPLDQDVSDTVTMMSYGFDPYLSSWSPYHGAQYAVLESVAKIVAHGGDFRKIRFTFQEYFRRMSEDPERWSQPVAALLGAYRAQMALGLPSIGGKDSMSGSFNELDVPPTLVSFAVDTARAGEIVSSELKEAGHKLVLIEVARGGDEQPDYEDAIRQYDAFHEDAAAGRICASYALSGAGAAAAAAKMSFGNALGVRFDDALTEDDLFAPGFGCIVAEVPEEYAAEGGLHCRFRVIGEVTGEAGFGFADSALSGSDALAAWEGTLESTFRTRSGAALPPEEAEKLPTAWDLKAELEEDQPRIYVCRHAVARPRVFIPVFPGTNCELDSARAFERAGAEADVRVFCNQSAQDIRDSVASYEEAIAQAQMIMFPGGFSAGDEPEGSAKFFATAFRNDHLREAVMKLLHERDGLVLGICNGFQALIKLGLVPGGEITGQSEDSPTLTYNTIGRHISRMVYTKVASTMSPWLMLAQEGATYVSPASHGEGRFMANEAWVRRLVQNHQVATVYADCDGHASMDEQWNVNGSSAAIEGITSPDGRVLGKMCHCERRGGNVAMNISGEQDLKLFEAGVRYFS